MFVVGELVMSTRVSLGGSAPSSAAMLDGVLETLNKEYDLAWEVTDAC